MYRPRNSGAVMPCRYDMPPPPLLATFTLGFTLNNTSAQWCVDTFSAVPLLSPVLLHLPDATRYRSNIATRYLENYALLHET